MSKHNNNLSKSSSHRCNCGRNSTIGEEVFWRGLGGYECPDCVHRRLTKPITREEYYKSFGIVEVILL